MPVAGPARPCVTPFSALQLSFAGLFAAFARQRPGPSCVFRTRFAHSRFTLDPGPRAKPFAVPAWLCPARFAPHEVPPRAQAEPRAKPFAVPAWLCPARFAPHEVPPRARPEPFAKQPVFYDRRGPVVSKYFFRAGRRSRAAAFRGRTNRLSENGFLPARPP